MVEGNVMYLPFEYEKFDAIACVHTLSHLVEKDRKTASEELKRATRVGGHIFVEGFGVGDLRFGEGDEVETSSFLRGNGILTHYFSEGEIPSLFPGITVLSELATRKRVTFGPRAGRRELIRVLMRRDE